MVLETRALPILSLGEKDHRAVVTLMKEYIADSKIVDEPTMFRNLVPCVYGHMRLFYTDWQNMTKD